MAHHPGGGVTKLFAGCLAYSKTEADLEPVFSQFGPLSEVDVLKDPSGSSKGAAFVTFQDETQAETAMACLQGHVLEGSTRGMNISLATSGGGPRGGGAGANRAPAPALRGAAHSGPSPWGSKLFLGQLPYSRTEADLEQLFGSVGPVAEVVLLKDRATQEKKGAAFVRFQRPQHAAAAAAALDGLLFAGSTRPVSVSLAQSEGGAPAPSPAALAALGQRRQARPPAPGGPQALAPEAFTESEPGSKLFVGQLPFSRSEADLSRLFGQYEAVVEVLLHRDAQGQKKGGAFGRFREASSAAAALELEGYVFEGSPRPIRVAVAGEGGAKRRRVG